MSVKRVSILSLLVVLTLSCYGQRDRSPKDNDIKTKLWYGGGAGLGFQSFNGQSTFLVALYPMVGYKLIEKVSIGPRIGVAYQHIRTLGIDGNVYRFNPIELSGGVFARYKPFYNIFLHSEYEVSSDKAPISGPRGIPQIETFITNNLYLGAGYTSGGMLASEIYILYNIFEDSTSLQPPWSIRGGLTYNF